MDKAKYHELKDKMEYIIECETDEELAARFILELLEDEYPYEDYARHPVKTHLLRLQRSLKDLTHEIEELAVSVSDTTKHLNDVFKAYETGKLVEEHI